MYIRIICLLAAAAVLFTLPGCGDEVVIIEPGGDDPGLVQGDINPDAGEFTITVQAGGTAQNPITGPFVIHVFNIEYVYGSGGLSADFTVANYSPHTYPLPVRLEFLTLLPAGVEVMNPSNDIYGPGAIIEFHFTDRDMHWTPGEVSIPRNVLFKVAPGVSIGFGARILVGPPPELGTISGVVWNDVDKDGTRDPDEFGLAGREVTLAYADSMFDCVDGTFCIIHERTTTSITGEYAFTGLEPNYYVVSLVRDRCSYPTTPVDLQVILVEENGGVSDFPYADFGVSLVRNCCGIVNGTFAEGELGWENRDEGPGVGDGVAEIIDVDDRHDVLRLDSRAGTDYSLQRMQLTSTCGVVGHALLWDWRVDPEMSHGLASVFIEFIDGAHAVVGRYFVRRHNGAFAEYSCDWLIQRHLEQYPNMFVGCEEIHATFAPWGTHRVDFSPDFFNRLPGPDVNPNTIAEIRVWMRSFNNGSHGADAYFDNFRYVGADELE